MRVLELRVSEHHPFPFDRAVPGATTRIRFDAVQTGHIVLVVIRDITPLAQDLRIWVGDVMNGGTTPSAAEAIDAAIRHLRDQAAIIAEGDPSDCARTLTLERVLEADGDCYTISFAPPPVSP